MLYLYNIDSIDFRLHEIYLDLYFKKFDIRVGKQQIVWGKADGVFITDIVSPLNLTEFLLPDFDEIRKLLLIQSPINQCLPDCLLLLKLTGLQLPEGRLPQQLMELCSVVKPLITMENISRQKTHWRPELLRKKIICTMLLALIIPSKTLNSAPNLFRNTLWIITIL